MGPEVRERPEAEWVSRDRSYFQSLNALRADQGCRLRPAALSPCTSITAEIHRARMRFAGCIFLT